MTYHDGKFVLANNILVLNMPNLNKNQKLFIGAIINSLSYGGYDNYPKIDTLKDDIISLPIKNGKIDFSFMESLISELEEERISELTAYLKVSSLEDYQLTDEDRKILNRNVTFKDFKICNEVFEVKNTNNILGSWIIPNSGIHPYVTASETNNSISTYIDYDKNKIEKGNGIMIGGKTLVITYQEKDYFSNDSHNLALYLKGPKNANTKTMLYLVCALYKSLKPLYTWGNSISKTKIKKDIVSLPVTENDEIDYDYMEKYIKAVEKVVIKNVVLWKDKVIDKTKDVVNNKN